MSDDDNAKWLRSYENPDGEDDFLYYRMTQCANEIESLRAKVVELESESKSRLEGLLGCTEAKRILIDKLEVASTRKDEDVSVSPVDDIENGANGVNDLAFFKEALQAAIDDREHYRTKVAALEDDLQSIRSINEGGFRKAYEYLGIEDDGEYRWKWLLLELSSVKKFRAMLREIVDEMVKADDSGRWDDTIKKVQGML